jgi:signal transduction histidine kinase
MPHHVQSVISRIRVFLKRLALPKSTDPDIGRREFVLNVLLLGSLGLTGIAIIDALDNDFLNPAQRLNTSREVIVLFILFLVGYLLSKKGQSRIVAYFFVGLYFVMTTFGAYRWGPDYPQGLLTYALVIVMAGVLVNTQLSFVMTALIGVSLSFITWLRVSHTHLPFDNWKHQSLTQGDTIVAVATLSIIAIVSWLFNRNMEEALRRAQASEASLKLERDSLEVMVEKRTRELREAEAEKLSQLFRFAEFGKSTSGLFHDLVNPLNLVSLNVRRLHNPRLQHNLSEAAETIQRAISGTEKLEQFVMNVRKQLQHQEVRKYFFVSKEISQVLQALEYKAKQADVVIGILGSPQVRMFGNPIKFYQLMTNLMANAIDSYQGDEVYKNVFVSVEQVERKKKRYVVITVQDHGKGISAANIKKVFEPFFTTKAIGKGIGIGLSISKEIVEKDFKGTISVASELGNGTTFTVEFPRTSIRKKSK